MKVFSLISFFGATCSLLVGLFFLWFFPWVLSFHFGFLVYFPYEPNGVSRYARLTGPLASAWSQEWVPSEKIPKVCKLALVASEDTKFYQHHGLDLESLEQSYVVNKKRKKLARGGSTLTQQLVKNAFLSRDKTYLRKVREIAGAVMLDASLSKDDQLTWYLNVVEFGPHLYGIQTAAQHYFKKDAVQLNKDECVGLVAVLPAPNKWNKSLERGQPTGFFASRTSIISRRMFILNPLVARSRTSSHAKQDPLFEPLEEQKLSAETLSQLPDMPEEKLLTPNANPSGADLPNASDSPAELTDFNLLDPADEQGSAAPESEQSERENSTPQ